MIFLTIKTHFLVAKLLIFFEISNFRKFYASTPYKHIRLRCTPILPYFSRQWCIFLNSWCISPKTDQSISDFAKTEAKLRLHLIFFYNFGRKIGK